MPAPDDPPLLCESCGYPIERLPGRGNCPECGRPIASSLPAARRGSTWQQRPGLRSFLETAIALVRRPEPLFDSLIVEFRRGTGFLALNLLIAAVIIVAPWYGTLIGDPTRSARLAGRHEWTTAAWVVPLQTLAVGAVLLALTLIEWLGIQFWSRRRGYRLLPAAAWQVCAHASIGWVAMATFAIVGMIVWLNLTHFGLSVSVSRYRGVGGWLLIGVPGLGALAGLLIFETLVYRGVQRCRFANPPRAEAGPA